MDMSSELDPHIQRFAETHLIFSRVVIGNVVSKSEFALDDVVANKSLCDLAGFHDIDDATVGNDCPAVAAFVEVLDFKVGGCCVVHVNNVPHLRRFP